MQSSDSASGADAPKRSAAEAEALVVSTIQTHADALLRVARRYSFCADDASDAYQRALEIFLRHSRTIEVGHAHKWLFRVVRNEAHAVREQRQRTLGRDVIDFDMIEARDAPSPEDRALAFDTVTRSAEALQRLKPQEVRALWMKASGRSYAEIASECGWTYTKVNRCITEGRRNFLSHYSAIEAGEECARWAPAISALVDGEADAALLAELRPHLRNCAACRADLRELHRGTAALEAVFPVALVSGSASLPADPGGWFIRLHDAVAAQFHERVLASAVKFQSAADVLSAGKVAAVAASAAAIAGGGLAVAGDVTHNPPRHAVPARNVAAVVSARRVSAPLLPVAAPATSEAAVAVPAAGSAKPARHQAKPLHEAAGDTEFAPAPVTAVAASAAAVPPSKGTQVPAKRAGPALAQQEFAP